MAEDAERLIKNIKTTYRKNLPNADSEWPLKVREAVRYIRDHLFQQELSVAWVKEQCRVNGNNFSGIFTFYVGMSPQKYYLYHRIEVANKILTTSELKDVSIMQIALHLGFKSHTSFSTTFKNYVGCTPSEFRDGNN